MISEPTTDVEVIRGDGIATVLLNRPPVNALTVATYRAIAAAFVELSAATDISVIVLASALPGIFCAGADIKDLERQLADGGSSYDIDRQAAARELFDVIRLCTVPVIASIDGIALGAGTVMAACCDFRVAAEDAKIGLTEINVARCGGTRHVSRILPQGVVRRMYFTGEPLTATEAWRLGAIEELTPPGQAFSRALELAQIIAEKSPVAVRMGKEALDAAEELTISEGYRVEQTYTVRLGGTDDAREATAAFREKRKPVWAGR
jgi:enoyl-CoA hydratase